MRRFILFGLLLSLAVLGMSAAPPIPTVEALLKPDKVAQILQDRYNMAVTHPEEAGLTRDAYLRRAYLWWMEQSPREALTPIPRAGVLQPNAEAWRYTIRGKAPYAGLWMAINTGGQTLDGALIIRRHSKIVEESIFPIPDDGLLSLPLAPGEEADLLLWRPVSTGDTAVMTLWRAVAFPEPVIDIQSDSKNLDLLLNGDYAVAFTADVRWGKSSFRPLIKERLPLPKGISHFLLPLSSPSRNPRGWIRLSLIGPMGRTTTRILPIP